MYSRGPSSAFESETFGEDLSFHIKQPVGSMSISPCGRDVVLASKEGLHVIDLDSPYSPPRYLPHRTSWEVADVQWSPFAARDFWVISTSNQKALVWNLGIKARQDAVEFVLHGHTRAITDINFSAQHPDVLATCAVDSFVHCWDLRVPARPVISFSDWFAGATQVKWSRQVSHVIASSHDKYLRIWDDRMGAYPVRSIEAHDTKIYGIDWNRHEQNRIVTCSLDKSIKFWDINVLENVPERIINTPFPAWRARHTPFGCGLLAMPQRGNGDIHLYDRRRVKGQHLSDTVPPVARFEGHKGQVKEFLWRPRGTIIEGVDHREFQLVTWGTDQELRLHHVDPETMAAIGYQKGVTQNSRLNFTRRGAKYRTFRDEPSDELFDEVLDSQVGSSPATGQSFHPRPRGSTGVGMSKVAIPLSQGWLHGSHLAARVGMHGRTSGRQIVNPIDWMKNVKITSWNPETLGEEITQVGEKFAKVVFESVEMTQRKAIISLHAPWGPSSAPMFMKFDIKFPLAYPREAAAIFHVQKTSGMTDELAGRLSTGLRTIAESYVARKRGCLEAVLRYLLREQDMESIVSWILDESVENSKIFEDVVLEQEVSSDEDDLGGPTFQGLSGTINSSDLQPKYCGALWADNGKLVCFFPSQPKQPTSFLEALASRHNDGDESGKIFGGFGRLQKDPRGAMTAPRTVISGEDRISEHSDDSSFFSSSSSGSSDNLGSLPNHSFIREAWRARGKLLQRWRSTDHSNPSALGSSQVQLGAEASSNVVSIHDLSELLPSRRKLATEYIVFGKGPDVCGYNADVATRHGLHDIAHVWHLMRLILWDEVPLASSSSLDGSSDILAIARSVAGIPKGDDSGVDVSYDTAVERSPITASARVRWGESALGGRFLVPALVRYFEGLGDIQMLAMLSCVFAEPRVSNSLAALSQQRYQHSLIQQKAPAFSVDYHPSIEVARSTRDRASTTLVTSANTSTKPQDVHLASLIDKASSSHPLTPYSTGTTPPQFAQHLPPQLIDGRRPSRFPSTGVRDQIPCHPSSTAQSGTASLSTSPEEMRSTHRANSNHPFPLSRASLSAFAPSFSQSPPRTSGGSGGNKRPSPVGSLMGQHSHAGGWGAAILGGTGSARNKPDLAASTARPRRSSARLMHSSSSTGQSRSMSSDGDAIERVGADSSLVATHKSGSNIGKPLKLTTRKGTKRKLKIKSALHNQNMFDNDGYASVPLLDPGSEWKYRAYRSSYARLLGVWELHTQRAEILKFDNLLGSFTPKFRAATADRSVDENELALSSLLPRKTLDVTRNDSKQKRGLEIGRPCNRCGGILEAIEKNGIPIGWHCPSCNLAGNRSSTRTMCAICTKSIAGLMVPCLDCGHVTCFECHRKWLARDSNDINTTDEVNPDLPEAAVENSCPTGCGCICSSHQSVSAPDPQTSEDEEEEVEQANFTDAASQSPARTLTSSEIADPMSTHGPDTAIGAFLSLSRTHSVSSSKATTTSSSSRSKAKQHLTIHPPQGKEGGGSLLTATYSDAWAKYENMGNGLGAGLNGTATLRERGSDATIRKASEAEARLRRAGSFV
ncbi:hypothetical protein GJ744_010784 [Endocarpon pusillum]|uniref:RING-type domain-containing protein n=1 Tax=Endocarpon pusillum TaxID=364733 RepID=A0A8H7AHI7_9EURO|nr:hypothetical protein GJ744_010784 [Endocarpon pusillum]